MRINKHDTNGIKPLLGKGELGYDDYAAGGDVGRVYVGTESENIPLAKKSEIDFHVNRIDNPHSVTKTQVGLGNVNNTADTDKNVLSATKWTTARTITLSGDVAGSASMDGTANVSITTTVQPNSVTLGTDTTGNYVAGITQGTGITVSGTAGEGWSPTVAITNVGTAGTYTKVTTNAQGQVTSGTTLAATDIPALDASKITTGIIDAARLPAYVDDVLEFANQASFPATGESGKIYIALNTNKAYRWSGSVYVYITSGAVDSVNGQTGVVNITTITGNAGTATALQTARTIGASGDVTGTDTSFNGSANITIPMTLTNSGVTAGTYSKVTVDAKGRVTAGLTPTMEDIPDATFKRSVRCATTANITLSGTQTIDGIAVVAGDRVLVKNQTTTSQNGIYVVAASTWTRALDANSSSKIASAIVAVDSGTVNGGKLFDNDFKTTDTLDTTSMLWNMNIDDGSLLTAGSTSVGMVKYNGTTATAGNFDGGTTTPTGATRLNYGGYFYPTCLNLAGSVDTTTASSHVFVETGTDGFVRPKTLANFKTEIFASPTLVTPNIGVATGTSFNSITGLSATTPSVAGTAAIGTSTTVARADHVHPVQTSVSGNAGTATKLTTARTISLTGDVTGSVLFDGSADASISATIAENSVALGTDTTGNYVAEITAGQGITISGTAGEGWSPTIALSSLDLTLFPTSNFKKSVKVATTANITLSGVQTIDGISVVAGDRILVKDQTTASQNGIYIVNASTWTRSVAADGANEIDSAVVGVDQGTTNGGKFFTNTFKTTDTVGTTAMPWYEVATTSSTVSSANTLATARTVQTNLGSTASASFNGSANITPGVTGTLPVSNGGTGATTLTGLVKGNGTSAMSVAVAGTDYVVPSGSITGNASTATTLQTARTISGVSFNGSANIDIEDRLGTAIASAATTTIGTRGLGDYIHITGTTTITSFGTAASAGVRRTLIFDGALTLTHNATSLICPGAANIVTVAGTIIEVVAETTANWRVVSITHPSLSMAELGYLDGVTSAIQTQLNAKAALASPALTGTPTVNGAAFSGYSGFKNYIINGNFDIWQRGTSQTTSGYGSDDRWRNGNAGSTKTHSRVACTNTERALFNASYFSRTVVSSVANADSQVLKEQYIENVTILAGKTVTLSFWAKADSNKNIGVNIAQVFGTGGSPSSIVYGTTQIVALTSTWQNKSITVTIPSIVGKTLGTDGEHTSFTALQFYFDQGSATTGSVLGQQSGTFDIAQVQLEKGSVATPFEQRPIGLELSLCQRYFYNFDNYDALYRIKSVIEFTTIPFPVSMRTAPTILSYRLEKDGIPQTVNSGANIIQAIKEAVLFIVSETYGFVDVMYFTASAEL